VPQCVDVECVWECFAAEPAGTLVDADGHIVLS
jgi:hypothetical protein